MQKQACNWEQRKLITCKTNHFKIKLKYILQTKNKNEVNLLFTELKVLQKIFVRRISYYKNL